jgi:sugar phosphate isomerase/epimerase
MDSELSRRHWLAGTSAILGAGLAGQLLTPGQARAKARPKKDPFRYSLNTSTIRGQKLGLVEEVEIAARAGYDAFEPWIDELKRLKESGGSLKDVGKRIRDRGLVVESSIGFCAWIVDDPAERKKGLEEARRSMDLVQQIGGKRLAAPPVGATEQAGLDLLKAAERYRALLELGTKIGVIPQAEVWGFSKTLTRLGDTALVAIESRHPQACILADVYHLYKGGSDFEGLKLLGSPALQVFHMNDYPARPGREKITDAHRVYPGDGIAPLKKVLRDLHRMGFNGILSLELFNPTYWKQDAFLVAQTGLKKMRALVHSSLE